MFMGDSLNENYGNRSETYLVCKNTFNLGI